MLNKTTVAMMVAASSAALVSVPAMADARGFAMGGVGVATSNYLAAPLHNPALAANYDRDRDNFGMLLPSLSVGVHDGDDLYTKIDDFADASDVLESEIDNPNGSIPQGAIDDWKDSLRALDQGRGFINADLGLVIAIPNRFASVSFFTKAEMAMIATANVDESDFNLDFDDTDIDLDDMNSTVQGLASVIADVGFTIAGDRLLQLGEKDYPIAFGISPKVQHLMAINYHTRASDFDDDEFEFGDEYTEETVFNVDLGMTFQPNKRTTVGFVAKNLLKQELETNSMRVADGNDGFISVDKMLVEPQYTIGMGYNYGWVTAAIDVDLNERKYFSGLDYSTQFASFGAEINAWRWAQVRVGYKHSMTDYSEDVVSAGLGLTPFGRFGLDLSAQYGEDSRYGAAAQFIFTF